MHRPPDVDVEAICYCVCGYDFFVLRVHNVVNTGDVVMIFLRRNVSLRMTLRKQRCYT